MSVCLFTNPGSGLQIVSLRSTCRYCQESYAHVSVRMFVLSTVEHKLSVMFGSSLSCYSNYLF